MEFDLSFFNILALIFTAVAGYVASVIKSKIDTKKQRVDELTAFSEANRDFRNEVRADLEKAHSRINELEKMIREKDSYILKMQQEITWLNEKICSKNDKTNTIV